MTSITKAGSQIAQAYAASQKLQDPAGAAAAGGDAGVSFAEMLSRAAGSVAESGRSADAVVAQAATGGVGRTDLVDVVTAMAESQAALETLVAVRDKVVSAYDEIMRMPI